MITYAYTDYHQVVGLAGHHVAEDWLQIRAKVEEEFLAARAKAVEGNPKGPVVLRPVRKTIYKRKPRGINVDKNYSEAVQKRINGLVSMFLGMGSHKPAEPQLSQLTDRVSWEAIPKDELEKARCYGLAEADRLLRQDR